MGNKLYVGNLPYTFRDEDLQQAFAAHGTVTSAKVMMERDTGRSKGFGFVEMGSDAEAQAAINGMNGQQYGGRGLVVNEARPMEARPPRTGGGGFGGGAGGWSDVSGGASGCGAGGPAGVYGWDPDESAGAGAAGASADGGGCCSFDPGGDFDSDCYADSAGGVCDDWFCAGEGSAVRGDWVVCAGGDDAGVV